MSVYEVVADEAWAAWADKDPEQPVAEWLAERSREHRVAFLVSVMIGEVFNGGFDQWIGNWGIDRDTALRNLYLVVFQEMKMRVRGDRLPEVVRDLIEGAFQWYDDQTTDRDGEMERLDRHFYDVAGENGSELIGVTEQFLFILEQDIAITG
jgi:hypothetical protein